MRIAYLLLIAVSLTSLGACATPPNEKAPLPKAIGSGKVPVPPVASAVAIDHVTYDCDNGISFGATFDDTAGTATIEVTGHAPIILRLAPTGPGFSYADSGYILSGSGDNATWTDNAKPSVSCKVRTTS